jgi:hypothetical protein
VFCRAEDSTPPFPTRAFVALGTAWVLEDLTFLAIPFLPAPSNQRPFFVDNGWGEAIALAWLASLAAKAMLMLGWFFLGEGRLQHRLAGLALFTPILVPFLVAAFFSPEAICVLATTAIFAVPLLFALSLPYALLKGYDHRLARDAPANDERLGQFTVKQLMLVTLVAAIVLGLLRWAQQSNMQWAVVGLQLPLLVWVFPFAMCRGLLGQRWYPDILFALGVTGFVLALPAFTLSADDVGSVALFVGTYVAVYAAHLLLLRWLGFRLVQYKPRFRYDPGIYFVERDEPGIQFVERKQGL